MLDMHTVILLYILFCYIFKTVKPPTKHCDMRSGLASGSVNSPQWETQSEVTHVSDDAG